MDFPTPRGIPEGTTRIPSGPRQGSRHGSPKESSQRSSKDPFKIYTSRIPGATPQRSSLDPLGFRHKSSTGSSPQTMVPPPTAQASPGSPETHYIDTTKHPTTDLPRIPPRIPSAMIPQKITDDPQRIPQGCHRAPPEEASRPEQGLGTDDLSRTQTSRRTPHQDTTVHIFSYVLTGICLFLGAAYLVCGLVPCFPESPCPSEGGCVFACVCVFVCAFT